MIGSICNILSEFLTKRLFELPHQKCKEIIKELESIEKQFIKKLKFSEKTIQKTLSSQYMKKIKINEIINSTTNFEFQNFTEVLISVDENKAILALKCFEKLKFLFSGFSHIIHYNNITYEMNDEKNEIVYAKLFQPKVNKKYYFNNIKPSVDIMDANGSK